MAGDDTTMLYALGWTLDSGSETKAQGHISPQSLSVYVCICVSLFCVVLSLKYTLYLPRFWGATDDSE